MISEKVANFGTLKEIVFGKPTACTSKLCNRFLAWLCLREIKWVFPNFDEKFASNYDFFVSKFREKVIYGANGP